MRKHEQEIDPLDNVYSALERVVTAWTKCVTDYTNESGDQLWYAVDDLTSANIAAKFDVPVRPERVALYRTAHIGFTTKPTRSKARDH